MTTKTISKSFILLAIFLLTIGCSEDNNDSPEQNTGNGIITAKIDGKNFEAKESNESDVVKITFYDVSDERNFTVSGVSSTERGFTSITLNLLTEEPMDNIVDGFEWGSGSKDFSDGTIISIAHNNSNPLIEADTYKNSGSFYAKFTSIDKENRLVSGIFNFVAEDFDDETKTHNITEGVFTNVSY